MSKRDSTDGDWMSGAVKHPGALRATAERRGLAKEGKPLTAKALEILAHSSDPTTRRRAALAQTFKKERQS